MKNDKSKVKSILSKSTQLLLSSLMTVSLMFTVPLSSQITAVVADSWTGDTSLYEPLEISRTSLNGNTIFSSKDVGTCNGLDNNAFYARSVSSTAGYLPDDGKLTVAGVNYQLANNSGGGTNPYDGNDSIKLSGDTGVTSATVKLRTYGAYERIYVLATCGGPGTNNYADFQVVITYTDGKTETKTYQLWDWYDLRQVSGVDQYRNIRRINSSSGSVDGNSSTSGGPMLQSAYITTNPGKLIKSVTFNFRGVNGNSYNYNANCGIYAITGKISQYAPSQVQDVRADIVNSSEESTYNNAASNGYFTGKTLELSWKKNNDNGKTTGYAIDIATDKNFQNLIVNNEIVSHDTHTDSERQMVSLTNLASGTKYYCRVRAVNESDRAAEETTASIINTNDGILTDNSVLSWSSVTNATSYNLETSTESDFSNINANVASTVINVDDLTSNSDKCQISYAKLHELNPEIGQNVKYYFRVTANTSESDTREENTEAATVTTTDPLTKTSTVKWDKVDDAYNYAITLSTSTGVVSTCQNVSVGNVTQYDLSKIDGLKDDQEYTVQVTAYTSQKGTRYSLDGLETEYGIRKNVSETTLEEVTEISNKTIVYWTPEKDNENNNITSYELNIYSDAAKATLVKTEDLESDDIEESDDKFSYDLNNIEDSNLEDDTTYYISLKYKDGEDEATGKNTYADVTSSLTYKESKTESKTDTVEWEGVKGAVSYSLDFYSDSECSSDHLVKENYITTGTSISLNDLKDDDALDDGTYYVVVKANFNKTVNATKTKNGTYVEGNDTTDGSLAQWTTNNDATGYDLYLYSDKNCQNLIGFNSLSSDLSSYKLSDITKSGSLDGTKVSLTEGTVYYVKVDATFKAVEGKSAARQSYSGKSSENAYNLSLKNLNGTVERWVKTQPKSFTYTRCYKANSEASLFMDVDTDSNSANDFEPKSIVQLNTVKDGTFVLDSLGQYNGDFEGNATSDDEEIASDAQWYYNIATYMSSASYLQNSGVNSKYAIDQANHVEIYKLTGLDGSYTLGVICAMTDQTVTFRAFNKPTSSDYFNPTVNRTDGNYYVFTRFDLSDTSIKQTERVLQNNKSAQTSGGYAKHVHNWQYAVKGSKIYAFCTESEEVGQCDYQGEASSTVTNLENAFDLTVGVTGTYSSGTSTEPTIQIGTTEELSEWNQKVDLKDWLANATITKKYYYSTGKGLIRKEPLSTPIKDKNGNVTEKYKVVDENGSNIPTLAGNYVIDLTISYNNVSVTVPVAYSINTNGINVPDDKKPQLTTETLTYDGTSKSLIDTTKFGTSNSFDVVYQITKTNDENKLKSSKWTSVEDCKVTDAGTYYVWYKAIPRSAEESEKIECLGGVTVNQKEVSLKYSNFEATYDGESHAPVVSINKNDLVAKDKNDEDFKDLTVSLQGMMQDEAVEEVTMPGVYTATITLNSNYKTDNDLVKNYVVKAKASQFSINQETTKVTYGSSNVPDIAIKLDGEDYTDYFTGAVTYSNGTSDKESVGVATVKYTANTAENFVDGKLEATFLVQSEDAEEQETETVLNPSDPELTSEEKEAIKETLEDIGIENSATSVTVSRDLLNGMSVSGTKDLVSNVLTSGEKDEINGLEEYDEDSRTGNIVSVSLNVTANEKVYDPDNINANSVSTASYNSIINKLESVANVNTQVMGLFDLSIYKSINCTNYFQGAVNEDESTSTNSEVTETASPVTVTLTIPQAMKENVPENFTRTFIVVRSHENDNGTYEATVLNSVVDGNKISFSSDKFSDFAIVAKDVLSSEVKANKAVNGKNGSISGLANGYYNYKLGNGDYVNTTSKVKSISGLTPGTYTLQYSNDNVTFGNEFEVVVGNTVVNNNNNNNQNNNNQNNNNNNAGSKNNGSNGGAANNNASQSAPAATTTTNTVATAAATVAVGSDATSSDGATVTLLSDSDVSYKFNISSAATVSVPTTQVVNGKTYTVTTLKGNAFNGKYIKRVVLASTIRKINAKAFVGDHKLTYIKINSKTISVSNTAFYGLTKKEKKRIKVVVSKKMSKKNFNALRAKLVKLGLKKSNITRLTK